MKRDKVRRMVKKGSTRKKQIIRDATNQEGKVYDKCDEKERTDGNATEVKEGVEEQELNKDCIKLSGIDNKPKPMVVFL